MMSSLAAYLSALVRRIEALERCVSSVGPQSHQPVVTINVGSGASVEVSSEPSETMGFRPK